MKLSFPVLAALVAMVVLVACGGAISTESVAKPDHLVPGDANVMAQIQISRILADVDFGSLYSEAPKDSDIPQNFEDLLGEAKAKTGIDFTGIKQAVIFGDLARGKDYIGIVAQGAFDREQLLAALNGELDNPLTVIDYKGQEIHVADESADMPSISFLGDDTLVAGTLPAIQGVVDVHLGEAPRLTGKVYDAFNSMGDVLFSVALEVPPEALADFNDAGGPGLGLPIVVEAIQDLEVFSLAIDKPGDELKVEARLDFQKEESAAKLASTLDGLLSLAKGFAPSDDLRNILDKLELTTSGNSLNILAQVAIADLEQAAKSFEGSLSPVPALGR